MSNNGFEWRRESLVAASSSGSPNSVRVASLDNGGFVVVLEDGETPAFAQDRDILAVVYDRFGDVATPLFRASTTSGRIEVDPEVTAVPGGFVVVYEGIAAGSTSRNLFFAKYANTGTLLASGSIPLAFRPDFDEGDLRFAGYAVTDLANGGFVVAYEREIDEGGIRTNDFDDIVANVVAPDGAVGPQQEIRRDSSDDDNATGETSRPSITTLSNGAVVTVFNELRGDDTEVAFAVSTVTGASLVNTNYTLVTNNGTDEARPSVAALRDGGFVVAWVSTPPSDINSATVRYQIFENNGAARTAPIVAFTGDVPFANPIFPFGAIVEPLADGGFALLIDDDGAGEIFWRAYTADGFQRIGDVTVYDRFISADNIGLAVTDDGRIVTVYKETSGLTGDVYAAITDPRTNPVTGPAITAGADIVTLQQDADPTLAGGQGGVVDMLAGDDTVFGGRSGDTIEGGSGRDSIFGGQGDDFIDGASDTVTESNFGEDTLIGGAGNDTLLGGGLGDTIYGEDPFLAGLNWVRNPANGHYYAVVLDPGVTWREADAAADALRTGAHLASITSREENLFVSSIAPPGGALIGGFQDRVAFEPSGGFRWTSGEDFTFTNWLSGRPDNAGGNLFDNAENAVELLSAADGDGRAWDDISDTAPRGAYILETSGANDMIDGGAGGDFLDGGLGNDFIFGGGDGAPFPVDDTLIGGEGDDTLNGGNGSDTLTGGPANDVFEVSGGGFKSVTDFTKGEDRFDVSAAGIRTLNGITFAATTFTAGGTTVFPGVDPATLTAADFIFAPSQPSVIVDTLADEDDGDTAPGDVSLREALSLVAPGGTIGFAPALLGGTITRVLPAFVIAEAVTIDGDINNDGLPDITIDGANVSSSGLIAVLSSADGTVLDGLRLINSESSARGGAIRAIQADITVRNSEIADNDTNTRSTNVSPNGAGLWAFGADVVIENTLFADNRAENNAGGGAIYVEDGTLTISRSEIRDNLSFETGGGVWAVNSDTVITDTIIRGNRAIDPQGGGIAITGGSLTAVNLTIGENDAITRGSAIAAVDAVVDLSNVTVTGNILRSGAPTSPISLQGAGSLTVSDSIILGNETGPGFGEIDAGPLVTTRFDGLNIIGPGADEDPSDGVVNANIRDVFDNVTTANGFESGLISTLFTSMPIVDLEPSILNPAIDAASGPAAPSTDALGRAAFDAPFQGASGAGAAVRDLGAAERTDVVALLPTLFTDEDTPLEIDALAILASRGFDTEGFALSNVTGNIIGQMSINEDGKLFYDPTFSINLLPSRTIVENFSVFATGPNGGVSRAGGAIRVSGLDEEPTDLSITADAAAVPEGDSGLGAATFTLTRSGNLGFGFTVDVALIGDADGAFLDAPTVSFAQRQETATVTAFFEADLVDEPDETIGVDISSGSSLVNVVEGSATTTISNDDRRQANLVGVSFNTLAEPYIAGQAVTIAYAIANTGTAASGAFTADFRLSGNDVISDFDFDLGDVSVGSIAAGGSVTRTDTFVLPGADDGFYDRVSPGADGEYAIGMILDSAGVVDESDETDNAGTGNLVDFDRSVIDTIENTFLFGS